jgi:hypothetical protein
MGTYSTIDCSEEFGSVRESFGRGDMPSASVSLRCAWEDRIALAMDLVDNARLWPHTSIDLTPYAMKASIVGEKTRFTTVGQLCIPTQALLAVEYGFLDPNNDSSVEDSVTETLEPTIEFLQLDYKKFRWAPVDGGPSFALLENEAPGIQLRMVNIVRTYNKISSIPAAVWSAIGGVNNATYFSAQLGQSFPAETLLYQPPTATRTFRSDGSSSWNLTLKFTYKPQGWNNFWNARTQEWARIVTLDEDGDEIEYRSYPLKNFAGILG